MDRLFCVKTLSGWKEKSERVQQRQRRKSGRRSFRGGLDLGRRRRLLSLLQSARRGHSRQRSMRLKSKPIKAFAQGHPARGGERRRKFVLSNSYVWKTILISACVMYISFLQIPSYLLHTAHPPALTPSSKFPTYPQIFLIMHQKSVVHMVHSFTSFLTTPHTMFVRWPSSVFHLNEYIITL